MELENRLTKAIPTDQKALDYLKLGKMSLAISPSLAQRLYAEKYILSNHNFVCPTDKCSAAVTCRSIALNSKNSPTFINHSRIINEHISDCPYNLSNSDAVNPSNYIADKRFNFESSDEIFSSLSPAHGFQPPEKSKSSRDVKNESDVDATNRKQKKANSLNKSNTIKSKTAKKHLNTLKAHVELYNHDQDFLISIENYKEPIKIKSMFSPLTSNVQFRDLQTKKGVYIYYSDAFLSKTKKDKVLRLSFKSPINQGNGKQIYPSLIISKEYIEDEYHDIYNQFSSGKETTFKVYITLPFLKVEKDDRTYINFSSFKKPETISAFEKELFYNIYITNVSK